MPDRGALLRGGRPAPETPDGMEAPCLRGSLKRHGGSVTVVARWIRHGRFPAGLRSHNCTTPANSQRSRHLRQTRRRALPVIRHPLAAAHGLIAGHELRAKRLDGPYGRELPGSAAHRGAAEGQRGHQHLSWTFSHPGPGPTPGFPAFWRAGQAANWQEPEGKRRPEFEAPYALALTLLACKSAWMPGSPPHPLLPPEPQLVPSPHPHSSHTLTMATCRFPTLRTLKSSTACRACGACPLCPRST